MRKRQAANEKMLFSASNLSYDGFSSKQKILFWAINDRARTYNSHRGKKGPICWECVELIDNTIKIFRME